MRDIRPPLVDFSGLANLPDAYFKGQQQRQQRDVMRARKDPNNLVLGPDGNVDFAASAQNLIGLGDFDAGLRMAQLGKGQGPTSGMREFELARTQGFAGGFLDYQKELRKSGADNITVGGGKYGTIPSGYQLNEGSGGGVSMQPIEGSPQAQEIEDAEGRADINTEQKAFQASTMMGAISGIKKVMQGAKTPAVGTTSIPFSLYSGSPAGKVRSYVATLRSPIALGAMMRLKDASASGATGFGQMNRAELELLINDVGVLDPDNTDPEIFLETIDRIAGRAGRVLSDIRRNVSPEHIKELGLEPLIEQLEELSGEDGGSSPSQADSPSTPDADGWTDLGDGMRIREMR